MRTGLHFNLEKFYLPICFFLILALYILTAPRTVTFEDSGLFILSGYYWGLAHPPGYPLYTLVAHFFTYLPVGEIAFRVALLSCLAGALNAALSYLLFKKIGQTPIFALLTTLLIFTSSTVWSQMIVVEVYALNVFLCLLFIYQSLKINELVHRHDVLLTRSFFLLGLIGALNLSNHWPLFILVAPGILFSTTKQWYRAKNIKFFLLGLSFFVLPYILMAWRSQQNPEVSFLGPIESLSELVRYFMRSYYSHGDTSPLYSLRDYGLFFWSFLERIIYKDFFPVASLLFFYCLWGNSFRLKRLGLSGFYILCSTTLLLPILLRLEFNTLNENVFRVFWLMPFWIFGSVAGEGARLLNERRAIKGSRNLLLRNVGGLLLACAVLANLFCFFDPNNLRHDRFAKLYAEVVLRSVPQGRPLVASTDGDVGPIAYVNKVLGVNSDSQLYTGSGVFFKDRIFPASLSSASKRQRYTEEFIKTHAPVYSVKNLNSLDGGRERRVHFNFNGVTYKYTEYESAIDSVSAETVALAEKALDHYIEFKAINNWPYHRATLAARLCNVLVLNGNETHRAFRESADCALIRARHLAANRRRESADALFLSWYRSLQYPVASEMQQHVYYFLINRLDWVNTIKGNPVQQRTLLDEGIKIAEQAILDYPVCDNKLLPVFKSIKNQVSVSEIVIKKINSIPPCP